RNGAPRPRNFARFAKQGDRYFLRDLRNRIRNRKLLRFSRQLCHLQTLVEKGIAASIDAKRKLVLDAIADFDEAVCEPIAQAAAIEHRHDKVDVCLELNEALFGIRDRAVANS